MRAVPGHKVTRVGNRGGQGTARPTADFLRKRIALLLPRLQQQEQTGYIPMDEGCRNLDLSTQGSATSLAKSLLGRARHSVRAVPGHQVTRVGNRGGQRTGRPTRQFPNVNFNGYTRFGIWVEPER